MSPIVATYFSFIEDKKGIIKRTEKFNYKNNKKIMVILGISEKYRQSGGKKGEIF